jgi:hypothetical protein
MNTRGRKCRIKNLIYTGTCRITFPGVHTIIVYITNSKSKNAYIVIGLHVNLTNVFLMYYIQ